MDSLGRPRDRCPWRRGTRPPARLGPGAAVIDEGSTRIHSGWLMLGMKRPKEKHINCWVIVCFAEEHQQSGFEAQGHRTTGSWRQEVCPYPSLSPPSDHHLQEGQLTTCV